MNDDRNVRRPPKTSHDHNPWLVHRPSHDHTALQTADYLR